MLAETAICEQPRPINAFVMTSSAFSGGDGAKRATPLRRCPRDRRAAWAELRRHAYSAGIDSRHALGPPMETFEPPKYLSSLIAAVNDGAKSAQLGALAFTAIGLFLLATSFSATDEDLLLNRALTISQLGGT